MEIKASDLPALLQPEMPGAEGPGKMGIVAPDGTRIVVTLERYDTAGDNMTSHIGIAAVAYEVDAAGATIGEPLPRWIRTAPLSVVASGGLTLDQIMADMQAEAATKITNQKAVLAQFDSLVASAALAPATVDTSTATASSIQ